ncbi:uncharacterized protein LOC141726884 [Zonotrichia albicollis]|uniref:uncharacterized protein LOC141726884 n=1 Tax=Zonotrichia albicollis TaxID=44394 RepID=UPI003D80F83B
MGSPAPELVSSAGGRGATSPVSGPAQPAGHAQSVKAARGGASVGAPSGPAPVGGQPAPLRSVGAVPTVKSCGLGWALIGGLSGSLVPPSSDVAPRAAPLSASRPSPASGAEGPARGLSRPVPDLRAVPTPASTEVPLAAAAARQGAEVFTFSATADTASGRPVGARGHGTSSSNLWTLPACQIAPCAWTAPNAYLESVWGLVQDSHAGRGHQDWPSWTSRTAGYQDQRDRLRTSDAEEHRSNGLKARGRPASAQQGQSEPADARCPVVLRAEGSE